MLKVIEQKDGSVILSETKTYEASKEELEVEITNIGYQKKNLLEQNRILLEQYRTLEERERSLQEILSSISGGEESEFQTL